MESDHILLSNYYGARTPPPSLDIVSFNPNLIHTGLAMITTHVEKCEWRLRLTAQGDDQERSGVGFELR